MGDLSKNQNTVISSIVLNYRNIKSDFLVKSDLFYSWEHMGVSNIRTDNNMVIRYARPLLIVSKKFKSAFEACGIKDVLFEKIHIN